MAVPLGVDDDRVAPAAPCGSQASGPDTSATIRETPDIFLRVVRVSLRYFSGWPAGGRGQL